MQNEFLFPDVALLIPVPRTPSSFTCTSFHTKTSLVPRCARAGESAGFQLSEPRHPNKGPQPPRTPRTRARIQRDRSKPAFVSGDDFSSWRNNAEQAEASCLLGTKCEGAWLQPCQKRVGAKHLPCSIRGPRGRRCSLGSRSSAEPGSPARPLLA